MAKLILILLVGLVFESTGVVLLKKGMAGIGPVPTINASAVLKVAKEGIKSPQILLGVFFEALFFGCLLLLMSRSDISFLWPMTGLSFVFATVAAMLFLNERVSGVRWAGVLLIMLGAALISYSEHQKDSSTAAPSSSALQ